MKNEAIWIASFAREDELRAALRRLREAEVPVADVYAPYPLHGIDEALGLRESRLGLVTFAAGACGALAAFGFQAWTSAVSWPVNVGGKPGLSTLAFIPLTFEVTILCAGLATAAAFIWRSRLYPKPGAVAPERVTDDRFALRLEPRAGDLGELRRILEESGCHAITERNRRT